MKRIITAKQSKTLLVFHWFAWSAMCLTCLLLAIIIVPGEFVYPWPDETGEIDAWKLRTNELRKSIGESHAREMGHRPTTLVVFEHGWPKPFLARALVFNCNDKGHVRDRSTPWIRVKSGSKNISVSWSSYHNWPLSADGWILDWRGLLIDLLAAFAIVLSVGSLTHRWIGVRGGRLWAFQLRDLLGLATIVAIGLGVFVYHSRIRTREGLAPRLLPPGYKMSNGKMTTSQSYCGPVWLRKLEGNHYFPQLFHHITHASVRTNESWPASYDELLKFPYLHTLRCPGGIPVSAIEQLAECHSLINLQLTFRSKSKQPPATPPTPTMGIDDFQLLERLQLETIELHGDQVEVRHLEQLAALPTVKRIRLQGVPVGDDAIESLRQKYPAIAFEVLTDWETLFGS